MPNGPFSKERQEILKDRPTPLSFAVTSTPLLTHFMESAAATLGISRSEFVRRLVADAMERWVQESLYVVPEEAKAYTRTALKSLKKPKNSGQFKPGRRPAFNPASTPNEQSLPLAASPANSASED